MSAPIKVLIADDAAAERAYLKYLIKSHPSLDLVGEAENATQAAELILARKPDVVFLDVHMPGRDGFQLLGSLEQPPKIVFVSAMRNNALRAFEVEALDFLLKPVAPLRFAATVQRIERVFGLANQNPETNYTTGRLCLRTAGRVDLVALRDIAALEADGDFTRIWVRGEPPVHVCRRLGDFDSLLPTPPFARLDRSIIINLHNLNLTDRKGRDFTMVTLRDVAEPLTIGRTAAARLRELLLNAGRPLESASSLAA